ncbi:hypothetical protein V5H41_29515, partial [Salmonella enterica]
EGHPWSLTEGSQRLFKFVPERICCSVAARDAVQMILWRDILGPSPKAASGCSNSFLNEFVAQLPPAMQY